MIGDGVLIITADGGILIITVGVGHQATDGVTRGFHGVVQVVTGVGIHYPHDITIDMV
jgi:hypothetical protein